MLKNDAACAWRGFLGFGFRRGATPKGVTIVSFSVVPARFFGATAHVSVVQSVLFFF
jgi:hypothetical protein